MAEHERFQNLFRGRESAHGQFTLLPDGGKRVNTLKTGAPLSAWTQHLKGEGPFLGIIPIREDNRCYFGAIDVDDKEINHVELEQRVRVLKFPLVVCRSKSGGAHLYIFFKEPIPAATVISKLKEMLRLLQVKNPKDRAIEIFPKQKTMDPGGQGNWINLPYYGSDESNRYAIINGQRATLVDFLAHAEKRRLSLVQLEGIDTDHPLRDGPPCLIKLHGRGGFEAGERNNGLFNVGVYLRSRFPDQWQEKLHEYNERYLDEPLDDDELDDTVIKSLQRTDDYVYSCDNPPICDVCDKATCKKQKFGILRFQSRFHDKELPETRPLKVLNTEPPRFLLSVRNPRTEEFVELNLHGDEILIYQTLKKRAFSLAQIVMPSMKQHEWDARLEEMMKTAEQIEAPPDASVFGQFKHLLYEFMSTASTGTEQEQLEALSRGHPIVIGPRVVFRSSDLTAWLRDHRFFEYQPHELYGQLRRLDVQREGFRVGKQFVRAWSIPISDEMRQEEYAIPSLEGDGNPEF